MVTVAVQLDNAAYNGILDAVRAGKYASPHHFMVAAAWNQLALDEMVDQTSSSAQKGSASALAAVEESPSNQGLLAAVSLEGAHLPPSPPLENEDRILWGQVNRLLPVALGMRVLANLYRDHSDGVPVELWHDHATRAAIELRPRLRQWDEESARIPGMRWAIGMPDDTPESRHRYANQFLGMPRTSVLADGACLFLGLVVGQETPNGTVVLPSKNGAGWAALMNPVFDNGRMVPASTFSEAEVEFYLEYIRQYRHAESDFMQAVAVLVESGLSRERLDAAIAEAFPAFSRVSSTMRAGTLGRMSDLGLVERLRTGSSVKYSLTSLAGRLGIGSGSR